MKKSETEGMWLLKKMMRFLGLDGYEFIKDKNKNIITPGSKRIYLAISKNSDVITYLFKDCQVSTYGEALEKNSTFLIPYSLIPERESEIYVGFMGHEDLPSLERVLMKSSVQCKVIRALKIKGKRYAIFPLRWMRVFLNEVLNDGPHDNDVVDLLELNIGGLDISEELHNKKDKSNE